MKRGHQWIHFDAQFPLKFGHDLLMRFGPAGQLLFIQFLCACKRSYPQGQVHYRTEDELRVLLGADFAFVDEAGDKWTLPDYWKWCGVKRVTKTRTRNGRTYVTASRWAAWEDAHNVSERTRKASERRRNASEQRRLVSDDVRNVYLPSQNSRSERSSVRETHRERGEVGGVRLEGGGWRGEGGAGGAGEPAAGQRAENLLTQLDEIKNQAEQRTAEQP